MEEYTKERDKRKDRNTKQKTEVMVGGGTVGLLGVKFGRQKGKAENEKERRIC